ncbi:ubiquitin carboxyl-terminal hydrolase 29 isoform X2 [Ictalurus punctatus]|uniref:Ubiquitin carboxyl-terminal hydrolase 29 isoform X2 n=1 Tax=Ictalurus punctatus TaxID=7998 RepID=A0A2D0R8A7_ICTPU|nr:ubiquitin carboxyl-terminal hydrolase 29 isoform X2 [Ictalurus punctatus]
MQNFGWKDEKVSFSVPVTPTESSSRTSAETPETEKEKGGSSRIVKWCFCRNKEHPAAFTESSNEMMLEENIQSQRPAASGGTVKRPIPTASGGTIQSPSPSPSEENVQSQSPTASDGTIKSPSPSPSEENIKRPIPTASGGTIKCPSPTPSGGTTKSPSLTPSEENVQSQSPAASGGTIKRPIPTASGGTIQSPSPSPSEENVQSQSPTASDGTIKSPSPTPSEENIKKTIPTASGGTIKCPSPTPSGGTTKSPSPTPSGGTIKRPIPTASGGTIKSPRPTPSGGTIKSPSPTPSMGTIKSPSPTPSGGTIKRPIPTASGGTIKSPRPTPSGGTIKSPSPTPSGGTIKSPSPTPSEENIQSQSPTASGGTIKRPIATAFGGTIKRPIPTAFTGTIKRPIANAFGGTIKRPIPPAFTGTIKRPIATASGRTINIMTSIYTLFPDTDFDSKLLPGGLPNFLSNCYINASLQCLFTAESFCRELSDLLDNSTHTLEYSFLRCFVELWRLRNSSEVQGDRKKGLLLQALMKSAAHYNPEFTIDIQNDAHEFLCYCLTQMEESGRKLGWQEDVNPRCPVTSNFKFKMRNIITCSSCGSQQNNNVEVFNHVSVPLKHDSVDQCLSDVVHKRTLLESKCKVCGGDSASSRWMFHTLPRFLILQLNRFRMTKRYTVQKVETPVDITPELQINCFPQSDTPGIGTSHAKNSRAEARETDRNELGGSTSTYRLISVLNHIGRTACFGHYVSDCSSHNSHQWKIYDDELVRLTSETDVLERRSTSAYVLLYERVSTG